MHTATYKEIMNQPRVWRTTIDIVESLEGLPQKYWNADNPSSVVFSGCGSPYFLSQSLATFFRGLTGLHASAHPASNIWLFPNDHVHEQDGLLICVSRSGKTTEVVKAAQAFKEKTGGNVISITCYHDTELSQVSTQTIVLEEAQEVSLAQTQSFTSMLIASQCLINQLTHRSNDTLKLLSAECDNQLTTYHDLAKKLGEDLSLERFFFLGTGVLHGIANEGMLKLKEMTLSYSEAFHFLEFRHGPMAMVDNTTLVVGLVSNGAASQEQKVLREMRQMGARVLAVTPVNLPEDTYDYRVTLPEGFTDGERLALYLPILQLMAQYRAVARGLNPDSPDNLNAFVNLDLSYPDSQ